MSKRCLSEERKARNGAGSKLITMPSSAKMACRYRDYTVYSRTTITEKCCFSNILTEVAVSKDAFYQDAGTLKKFIEIIARLNSVKPTVEYAADVGRDMACREGYTRNWNTWLPWSIHVLNRIEEYAEKHLLGERLDRFCQSSQAEIKTLKRIALELIHVVPNLPIGLVHGDFHPGNTGWRKQTRELVVFDFDDIMFDTRFYDIAMVIGNWDLEGKHSETQRELAEVYLKTYSQQGGTSPGSGIEEFLKEISIVWYARRLNLWEHLPLDLHGPHYLSGAAGDLRQARLDSLYENMSMLMSRADYIESLLR